MRATSAGPSASRNQSRTALPQAQADRCGNPASSAFVRSVGCQPIAFLDDQSNQAPCRPSGAIRPHQRGRNVTGTRSTLNIETGRKAVGQLRDPLKPVLLSLRSSPISGTPVVAGKLQSSPRTQSLRSRGPDGSSYRVRARVRAGRALRRGERGPAQVRQATGVVVGSRRAPIDVLRRTSKLVRALVKHDGTVVSGLAARVDTMAHRTALKEGG